MRRWPSPRSSRGIARLLALACAALAACDGQARQAGATAVLAHDDGVAAVGAPAVTHASVDAPPVLPRSPFAAVPDAPAERSLGVVDRGVLSDLDARVQLGRPDPWLRGRPPTLLVDAPRKIATLYADARPIKAYPLGGSVHLDVDGVALDLRPGDARELAALIVPDCVKALRAGTPPPPGDADDDGIADPVDVLMGAHKTAIDGALYDAGYYVIPARGGDVPRDRGACTDVVIRALRNAGLDLQAEVSRDIARRPKSYPMVSRADTNIDHRRVRTLVPWFVAHADVRSTALDDPSDPVWPGDIVLMDTIPSRSGPDHIGVVVETLASDGRPLVVNSWTDGYTTQAMDLLGWVPVTHRLRVRPASVPRPLPAETQRLLVVVSEGWDDAQGQLHRFEREGAQWKVDAAPIAVSLGAHGMAWGRGLHGDGAPTATSRSTAPAAPVKVEGDLRSPAGVFALGAVRGHGAPVEGLRAAGRLAVVVDGGWVCVDDPASRHYGRIFDAHGWAEDARDWSSHERMARPDGIYALTIVVEHNTAPVRAGAGSCVFLHAWAAPGQPVSGCTAMDPAALAEIAAWVDGNTVLVALPRAEYRGRAGKWGLPTL